MINIREALVLFSGTAVPIHRVDFVISWLEINDEYIYVEISRF